jgi:tetratricopeptide (TPR) repeat protein
VKTIKLVKQIGMAVMLMIALIVSAGFGAPVAAQDATARVSGEVRSDQGRAGAGVTVSLQNQATGETFEATTNTFGRYTESNLPAGSYTISIKQGENLLYTIEVDLAAGEDKPLDFDFAEIRAGEEAAAEEAARKAVEARERFAGMKVHFDAALVALDEAKEKQAEMERLPTAQQSALQSQVRQAAETAATELQAALESTEEGDSNRGVLLARLGEAHGLAGKYSDSAAAYQTAVEISPEASSYNNLGNALARDGQVDEALAAYQKAIELDPQNTATYWRNLAVGLYNSGRIKESLDPLKNAVEADATSAQAWYLLGAALVNTMEFKREGDTLIPVITPGTVAAYEKALELDADGPFGAQAKDGLAQLKAMGLGVQTKIEIE